MTAAHIVSTLGGRNGVCRCPAHEDRSPSLAVAERNGALLVHCHAGCSQSAVVAALRDLGLWPEGDRAAKPDRRQDEGRVIEATYTYTDARGDPLYEIVRYRPKAFVQRYKDGTGSWVWRKHPHQVLYRLSEVLEAPILFLTEGEKDSETLRSHGFVSTTAAGGSKAPWLPSFTETLKGREVIIVPDNDVAGWQRARVVAKALLGNAARLRVFDLPKDTKDITDWFAAGHSDQELIAVLEGAHAV